MRKLVAAVMVMGFALLGASAARAQVRFGANLSWGSETDLGLGAHLSFSLGDMAKNQPVEGLLTFDYFFPDEAPGAESTYWDLTANAIYRFVPRSSGAVPYAGGGLLISRFSTDYSVDPDLSASKTDLGLSLVGGIRFKTAGTLLPFVEARFELKDNSQVVLTGGVFFGKP